jgi:type II secretory pathway component GspD/PulD (secretin)
MAKRTGLILKGGFGALLLLLTLSLAVWGGAPQSLLETKTVDNFEYYEADLRDVFRSLAEYGGINVLMDKQVQGTTTTRFQTGLTVKEAFEILAKTNGFSCYWLLPQNTVVVGNEATYKSLDKMFTKVYSLKYADVEAAAETLKIIIPKERIGTDKRTNQLAVRGNVLEHENVAETVAGLDREMPQISIEVRVEETTRTALAQLGVGWAVDDWSLGVSDKLKFTKLLANVSSVKLNLWEESSNSKILARPMVATTDSKEAMIFIGDKVPLIKKEVDDNTISYDVEFIDVGTKLVVTPRINAADIVTVNVKATLSNVTKTITVGNTETSYQVPYVRNREASSVIRLRDGETFMLSGLNQNESSLTKQGIKGLQKIPLLGKLFQKTTKEDPGSDTEIVIFITPRIIRMEPKGQVEQNAVKPPAGALGKSPASVAAADQPPVIPAVQPADVVKPVAPPVSTVQPATAVKPADLPASASAQPVIPPVSTRESFTGRRLMIKLKEAGTVSGIAALYGVSPESIVKDNALRGKNLAAGQGVTITVPQDHLYRLQPKETIWRLAKRYGVSVARLQEINRLEDLTTLEIGQVIILPVAVDRIVDNSF